MNVRKTIGIVIAIGGVVLILTSRYISARVLEGKAQIASGQSQVDTTESLFSLTPATKPVGKGLTESGRQRIAAGQMEVDRYEQLAGQLKMGGYAMILVGLIMFLIPSRKK